MPTPQTPSADIDPLLLAIDYDACFLYIRFKLSLCVSIGMAYIMPKSYALSTNTTFHGFSFDFDIASIYTPLNKDTIIVVP